MSARELIGLALLLLLGRAVFLRLFAGRSGTDGVPSSPVSPESETWLRQRWTWLENTLGPELARESKIVLPDARHFPDRFDGSKEALRRLVDRLCGYMHVDPATVAVHVFSDPTRESRGRDSAPSESSGAAGLYHKAEDGMHVIQIRESLLHQPESLVATVVHELAHVHLIGADRVTTDESDHEPLTDLLTVYLGLGVIRSNGALVEEQGLLSNASFYRLSRSGYLSLPEYGFAHALLARTRNESDPGWAKHLRPDVRSAFILATAHLSHRIAP